MKFLFLSQYVGSRKHGMGLRNYNWARALVEKGHKVTIVGSSYAHARSFQPEAGQENIDGIEYIWLPGIKYKASSYLGRIAAMAEFTLRLFFLSRKKTGINDVIIASSPHPFTIYPAWYLAKRMRARLIYDVRDLWPLTLKELGKVSSFNPFIWLMQKAENFACRKCDLLTSVPRNAESYFRSHGLKTGKFMAIANGVVSTQVAHEDMPSSYQVALQALQDQGKFIVGYAGTIGKANALHCLVEALPATDRRVHLAILGTGIYLDDVKARVHAHGLDDRVTFFEPVLQTQVADFVARIDVGYAGTLHKDLYKYGASLTKINDYMLASKPILYSVGDPNNSVEASGAGIACPAEDVPAIAEAMNLFAAMSPDDLHAKGQAGYKWLLSNQLVSAQMDHLLQTLTQLPTDR